MVSLSFLKKKTFSLLQAVMILVEEPEEVETLNTLDAQAAIAVAAEHAALAVALAILTVQATLLVSLEEL